MNYQHHHLSAGIEFSRRRAILGTAAALAGAAIVGPGIVEVNDSDNDDAKPLPAPKPIPGTLPGTPFHVFAPGTGILPVSQFPLMGLEVEPSVITDFRGMKDLPVGNRFLVFTMFPDCNVEARIFGGHAGQTVIAAGSSIFNRTCKVNIGKLLGSYGGGGHQGAGTAQLPADKAEVQLKEILGKLKANKG